jgi:hypothetical protein
LQYIAEIIRSMMYSAFEPVLEMIITLPYINFILRHIRCETHAD